MTTENQLIPSDEVNKLTTETNSVVESAKSLVIADSSGLQYATDVLGWVAKAKKNLEERRKFFTKPLNDQVKRINDLFKDLGAPLETADSILRGKVLTYRQEQEKIRRAEEERLRKLQQEEQRRIEAEAIEKGEVAVFTPPPPAPVIQQQAKTVSGDYGAVSAKLVWDFDIVDEAQIPREFLLVNDKAIRAAVKAGVRNIPGVKVYQKEELAVRAR